MTNYDRVISLMYEIVRKRDAIDRISVRLNNRNPVFADISLEKPRLNPAELGLLRTVAWFYVLYNEVGGINVEFLSERLKVYNLDSGAKLSQHLALVNRLRTYFYHNLNPSKSRDIDIQEHCQQWLKQQCGTADPEDDEQWFRCLHGFLDETLQFFEALLKCIRLIEQDESRELVLRDWEVRRNRFHHPYEFDPLIARSASDMGKSSLDIVKFRNTHYQKWIKELSVLQGNYDFEVEGRKLIEYALLNELARTIPLTGRDILETFESVEPGPKVGKLLQVAKSLYEEIPCSKEQLLDRLRNHL